MRYMVGLCLVSFLGGLVRAEAPLAFPDGHPQDRRSEELRTLNGYFPFQPVSDLKQWKERQAEIRRRILVSQGLWPLPTKASLNAVIHGRVDRDDYVVDRVFFESVPGHFVTGSLYRPKGKKGPFPAVLSPHGHWSQGRFYDAGEKGVQEQIKIGGESYEIGGRYPLQARAVQLARMGCVVFHYDMTGNADSIQIAHRPAKWSHLDTKQDWGFMSVQADLRLQNMMGLQTWNSIRAIDFLLELDDVDPARIGVTGASGGGTQTMLISAIDDRIAASMPCVMVSTAMQGGCTCENAPLLRIDQGNIDIAAATAPRPMRLTAADDWTVELKTKGYPDLVRLYEMLGYRDRMSAVFHTEFKHNYNQVNRAAMYDFFNQHFQLGFDGIQVADYTPLTREEATVWNDTHPAPSGDQIGDPHEIQLLRMVTADSDHNLGQLVPDSSAKLATYRSVVGGAWETILGRRLDQVGDVVFEQRDSVQDGSVLIRVGYLNHASQGEQVPLLKLEPSDRESSGVVILATDEGKASIFDGDQLDVRARRLVEAGYTLLVADLFGQGEFLADHQPLEHQRMWYQPSGDQGWKRFSGYTYGYNHCLFAKRVHDLLSVVKYASSQDDLFLVGIGRTAGPLALAACSQSGEQIDRTVVDMKGFRFQQLNQHDDPMFVPGAVKYLDVDGLISLCAPAPLVVLGQESSDVGQAVYGAADAAKHAVFTTAQPDAKAWLEWLSSEN